MPRRLYLGKLAPDTRSDDVAKLFDGFGKMVDCRVMTGFGFVEFENSRDAEDAVQQFNGKSFMGTNIVVEFAKESRPRREPYDDRYGGRVSRRPPGFRVVVTGISRDTSWQDLKDFGREAGSVSFSDIDRDVPGQGILEYLTRDDAERAVNELDGKDLRGNSVRVNISESRDGPDNFRRDDDRRRDYGRDSRDYRDDRDRYPPPRRDRSRSPPRRSDYDRPRSPPPRDRRSSYDDRKGGYDDRRGPDRRDSGRDDRRRDDDRIDDRPRGDGGWAR